MILAVVGGGVVLAGAHTAHAAPQESAATSAGWHVVTGSDVFVRSGAASSYYPFAKLPRNALVRAIGSTNGYLRVVMDGPAFKDTFGYVKVPASRPDWFQVEADGRHGVALRKLDVIAPNMTTLAEKLRAAGYRTHAVGKVGEREAPLSRHSECHSTSLTLMSRSMSL